MRRSLPCARALGLVGLLVVASSSACTRLQASGFCQKEAQCLDEEEDVTLEPDSVNVCVAEFESQIAELRANEEPECQNLAQAILDFSACRASLDCNDFFDPDDIDDKCGDQQEALDDAIDDVDGAECSPQES
jgi:hypothetical protein